MMIAVHIPSVLRETCRGAAELHVEAATVGAVLNSFEQQHPALYRSICDETGAMRRHVSLFVNSTLVLVRDEQGRQTGLKPGDVISIFQAVSGG